MPVQQLRAAIAAADGAHFERAFAALTAGCNGCHQATGFGFNIVVQPTANSFPNQDFALKK